MRHFVVPMVVILFGAGLTPASARAAQRTALSIEATRADGVAFADTTEPDPRYSQAIAVNVRLALEDDTALAGEACQETPGVGQPCRVEVSIGAQGGDTTFFVFDPVFDTAGVATARIVFVDGAYGEDSVFTASTTGTRYAVRAVFRGNGPTGNAAFADCQPAAAETADGDFCPAEATIDVPLFLETAAIEPGAGLEGALGDELTLSAALEDPNGDAALGGTDVDGAGDVDLVGRSVTFFYDVDNDGNAEANEIVGTAATNSAGVASLTFTIDPNIIRAGEYDAGLQVEFGGDGQYGVARAATRVVVRPADVDIARTIIEVDPPEIPADGFSKSTITVRLVDTFNNPLDETSEPHDVVITSDNGILLEEVELDLLTGVYRQELQAQRKDGAATITVTVDGEAVPATRTVEIVGEGGCRCASSSRDSASSGLLACGGAALLLARRVSKSRRR